MHDSLCIILRINSNHNSLDAPLIFGSLVRAYEFQWIFSVLRMAKYINVGEQVIR
jgi:hypothetical protein